MVCRILLFVFIYVYIIIKRIKIINDLKFKKMKEIWIMVFGVCIWLENIWYGYVVKIKMGMKNRNFFKKKSEFFIFSFFKISL